MEALLAHKDEINEQLARYGVKFGIYKEGSFNGLVELLRSHTSTRTALVALNMILDLDQMLKAIDGDVALELLSPASILSGFKLSDISDFCLTAELSNTDFMERASTWGNDFIQVNALTDNEYRVISFTDSIQC